LLPDDPAYLRKRAYQLLEIAKTVSDLTAIEVLEGVALDLLTQAEALTKVKKSPGVRKSPGRRGGDKGKKKTKS